MATTKVFTAEEIALLNNMCPVAQRTELGDFLSEVQTVLSVTGVFAVAGTSTANLAAILGANKNLDYLRLAELQHSDNEVLVFGTGAGVGGDISTKFDGSDLITSVVGASEGWKIGAASHVLDITLHGSLTLGVDDTGYDMKLFGATASKYLWWDQAHDSLFIVGALDVTGATLLKGTVGMGTSGTTFTVAADGSLAIATSAFTVSAAGLVTAASRMDAKGGFKGGTNLTEFLVGADGSIAVVTDKFTVSAAGAVNAKGAVAFGANLTEFTVSTAGVVAIASTLGVTGDLAVNSDFWKVTAATGDVAQKNIQADATGVTHTVTKARAAAVCVANDVIWQLIASGMNTTPAQKTVLNLKALMTGVTAGAEAGAFTVEAVTGGAAIAEVFRLDGTGIVLPATVTRGIRIGSSASAFGSGVALSAANFQGSGFFYDDGGVALTAGTSIEGVMARLLISQAIAGGIDVSASAFHASTWIRANYTGAGGVSGLWGQFSVPTGVTIDTSAGIGDVAGGHCSLNIPSGATLAANSWAAGVSVGGDLGGTLTGLLAGLRIRTPSAGTWDAAIALGAVGDGTTQASAESGGTAQYLKVYIGTKLYTIAMATAA